MNTLIVLGYNDRAAGTTRTLVKLTTPAEAAFYGGANGKPPAWIAEPDPAKPYVGLLGGQQVIPEIRDATGIITRPGGLGVVRDWRLVAADVTSSLVLEVTDRGETALRSLYFSQLGDCPSCERCKVAYANGRCCSSHGKLLCHGCYRRTHFVELCAAGCPACASEGLPVNLYPAAAV